MIGIIVVMHQSKLRPNGFELINNYIKTLYKYFRKGFNLYLVDNSSVEEFIIPEYYNIKYTYVEDQMLRGVTGPWNDNIITAINDGCDIILITNDDITFNDSVNDFIGIMGNHKFNNIGLYAPLTDGVIKGFTLQEGDKLGDGILETTNEKRWILNGFFMGFTKEFYEKFKFPNGKLFVEKYKWGMQESDLQRRIKPKGGRMFVIKNCWIHHNKIRGWIGYE